MTEAPVAGLGQTRGKFGRTITPFANHLGEKDIHFREVWNQ